MPRRPRCLRAIAITQMRHSFLIIICALAAALLGACSSARHAAAPAQAAAQADTAWHTLYAPVKLSLRQPMAFSASSRATMVRDSLIHLSVRVFGMEVAQVRATADSAWLVSRYHKVYTAVPLRSIASSSGLTLGHIQDLLLGQGDFADLVPAAAGTFGMDASGFKDTPAGRVASLVDITANLKNRSLAASLEWDLGKARWNGTVDTQWSIPQGCRYIAPEELLSSLKNF